MVAAIAVCAIIAFVLAQVTLGMKRAPKAVSAPAE
jgi:hypothetical protein